ncbi:MAG: hypothetical protein Q7J78_04730 [Clostridiales bacterium]|nr:hypothetical protein [Clostridiales bacterium]
MVEDIIADSKASFRIKIVGVFRIKEENNPFWSVRAGGGDKVFYRC